MNAKNNVQSIRMLGLGLLPVTRVAEVLGLSTPRVYQLLYEKRIRGQRVGRKWYVDIRSVRAYLTDEVPIEQQPTAILGEIDRLLSIADGAGAAR